MKLINLNTWAGRIKEPFEAFLKTHTADTDIFCFQEVYNNYEGSSADYSEDDKGNTNLLQEISDILVDFEQHFCPVAENVYGIAIFLKKGIEVIRTGEILVYTNPNYDPTNYLNDHDRKMQWIHIKQGTKDLLIMNTHGHWGMSDKNDTPNNIQQSKAINAFIQEAGPTPKILVGDFNLNANTESLQLLETYFINLVKEHGIATTRTEFYKGENRHSDYIFVSPEVFTNSFKVLPDIVSDHAPLLIDFDVF